MLDIRVNNESLDLFPDAAVDFEIINNALDFENVRQSHSWDISIPLTEKNRRILGHVHDLYVSGKTLVYCASLFLKGNQFFYGSLSVLTVNPDSVSANFVINPFAADFLDKKLSEINYGNTIQLAASQGVAVIAAIINETYDTDKICFPAIKNESFYGDSNPDFLGIINNVPIIWIGAWFTLLNGVQVTQDDEGNNIVSVNRYTLVPMMWLKYAIEKIFADQGYQISGEFMRDTKIDDIPLHNNYALDKIQEITTYAYSNTVNGIAHPTLNSFVGQFGGDDKYVIRGGFQLSFGAFPPIIAKDGTQLNDYDFQWDEAYKAVAQIDDILIDKGIYDRVNYLVSKDGYHSVRLYGKLLVMGLTPYINLARYGVQMVYNGVIVDEIQPISFELTKLWENGQQDAYQDFIDIDVELGHVLKYASPGKLYLNVYTEVYVAGQWINTGMIGVVYNYTVEINNVSASKINLFDNNIDLENHVPDITVGELLTNLKKTFNLQYRFHPLKKEVEINYAHKSLTRAQLNFSDKMVNQSPNIDYVRATGYKLGFNMPEFSEDNVPDTGKYDYKGSFNGPSAFPAPLPNMLARDNLTNNYYHTVTNEDGSVVWEVLQPDLTPVTLGVGETELSMEMAPCLMGYGFLANGQEVLLPVIDEPGNSPPFGTGFNAPSLRIFNYIGRSAGGSSLGYHFATPLDINPDGSIATDRYRFTLDDSANSLYANLWEKWLIILDGAPVITREALLTLADLKNLDERAILHIDYINYLIKTLKFRLSNAGLHISELELLKI